MQLDVQTLSVVTVFVTALLGALLVFAGLQNRAVRAPMVWGAAYIVGAYWFTSSTSFANPAVTIGRLFSDTFAGIAPDSVLPYVAAQLVGAAIGVGLLRVLFPTTSTTPKGTT